MFEVIPANAFEPMFLSAMRLTMFFLQSGSEAMVRFPNAGERLVDLGDELQARQAPWETFIHVIYFPLTIYWFRWLVNQPCLTFPARTSECQLPSRHA